MKNYTKPSVEIVELSVKESLSALKLPSGFNTVTRTRSSSTAAFKNVTIYANVSTPAEGA